MSKHFMVPFLLTILSSTIIQCCIALWLWSLFPRSALVTAWLARDFEATFVVHNDQPWFISFALTLLFMLSSIFIWDRSRVIALGLCLSGIVGFFLGIAYLMQDVR